jgi:hypothetical protein
MRTLPRYGLAAAMTLVPLALMNNGASAQQPATDTQACVAHVLPTSIPSGITASRLTVTLSKAIGDVTRFTPDEDSGITLADPKDLPPTDMARQGEAPKPIQMSNDAQSRVTVWLNTKEAKEGDYHFTLKGADGVCSGSLKVVQHS